jgi:epsilon-lactone hydrolase
MKKALLSGAIRLLFKPVLSPRVPIGLQRQLTKSGGLISRPPRGVERLRTTLNGVPALHFRSRDGNPDHALLFLHGGGYVLGGEHTHRRLAAWLSQASGAQTYMIDYRLAPEHPYPAALEDALAAYRALLEQHPARHIALAGDSAGGNLSLVTAIAIRDAGLPAPAALGLISPWIDLGHSGETIRSHARRDPMISPDWGRANARHYAGDLAVDDPRISPLFADLKKLPPMLIHVGSEETLLSDAERLEQRAVAAGVEVRLHRYEGLWHDFQLHAGVLKESDQSIAELGGFLRSHLA